MTEPRNCKEYCYYKHICHSKGEPGLNPDDCPRAWRIEDMIHEPPEEPDEPEEKEEFD
jgi:hypothetical protein